MIECPNLLAKMDINVLFGNVINKQKHRDELGLKGEKYVSKKIFIEQYVSKKTEKQRVDVQFCWQMWTQQLKTLSKNC